MKNAPAGYYLNGTPDGSREGRYYVNNHNLEEWCVVTACFHKLFISVIIDTERFWFFICNNFAVKMQGK